MKFEGRVGARGDGGHVVALPFDAREAFGKVRAPVRVTIGGHTFRTTAMRYAGVDYIGLNQEVREAAGVAAGDPLTVELDLDRDPREVTVPQELAVALAKGVAAKSVFDGLSYTHRKEYARWIADAKREETRTRRLAKAVEMLRAGVRTPG